jgi:protein phosphatase PTC1
VVLDPNEGVLAVTRSLGDLSMKEFVIGNPFTTETDLDENDLFIILACDGVTKANSDLGCVY